MIRRLLFKRIPAPLEAVTAALLHDRLDAFSKRIEEYRDALIDHFEQVERQPERLYRHTLCLLKMLNEIKAYLHEFSLPASDGRFYFVMDSFFITKCSQLLHYEHEEKMLICAGPVIKNVRFLTQLHAPTLDSSPAHVKPSAGAFAQFLKTLEPFNLKITGIFHSHPGMGVPEPSSADLNYHRILEGLGHRAIGAIFNNAGYVRFFTHKFKFDIIVLGENVQVIDAEEQLWKVGGKDDRVQH